MKFAAENIRELSTESFYLPFLGPRLRSQKGKRKRRLLYIYFGGLIKFYRFTSLNWVESGNVDGLQKLLRNCNGSVGLLCWNNFSPFIIQPQENNYSFTPSLSLRLSQSDTVCAVMACWLHPFVRPKASACVLFPHINTDRFTHSHSYAHLHTHSSGP